MQQHTHDCLFVVCQEMFQVVRRVVQFCGFLKFLWKIRFQVFLRNSAWSRSMSYHDTGLVQIVLSLYCLYGEYVVERLRDVVG